MNFTDLEYGEDARTFVVVDDGTPSRAKGRIFRKDRPGWAVVVEGRDEGADLFLADDTEVAVLQTEDGRIPHFSELPIDPDGDQLFTPVGMGAPPNLFGLILYKVSSGRANVVRGHWRGDPPWIHPECEVALL